MKQFLRHIYILTILLMVIVGNMCGQEYILNNTSYSLQLSGTTTSAISLNSIEGDILTFSGKINSGIGNASFSHDVFAEYSVDGDRWIEIGKLGVTKKDGHNSDSYYIHARAKYLRFRLETTGTRKVSVYNVKLTKRTNPNNNHVPFTLNSPSKFWTDLYSSDNDDCMRWDNGIRFSDDDKVAGVGGGRYDGGYNWNDKYTILYFTGVPHKLSFTTSTDDYATTDGNGWFFYVADAETNSVLWSSESETNTVETELPKSTRYLKLCYTGNLRGWFKNISITQLEQLDVNKSSLVFEPTYVTSGDLSQEIEVEWSSIKPMTWTLQDNGSTNYDGSTIDGKPQYSIEILDGNSSLDNYGKTRFKITYDDSKAGNHKAVLTLSGVTDDGNTISKTVTIDGTRLRKKQQIAWVNKYQEAPIITEGEEITNAATATLSPVKYKTENDVDNCIEILNGGLSFKAVKASEGVTIVAYQEGNDEFDYAEIKQTFKVSNKQIQYIQWGDQVNHLYVGDADIPLTAKVYLEDTEGHKSYSAERTGLLYYTIGDKNNDGNQDTEVVTLLNGNVLRIVGVGETTLTATVPGNEVYEEFSVTLNVHVYEKSEGCPDVLIPFSGDINRDNEIEFNPYSGEKEQYLNLENGNNVPGVLEFGYVGRQAWGSLSGKLDVYEVLADDSERILVSGLEPKDGNPVMLACPLSRNTKKIRFHRYDPVDRGYFIIRNISITPAQYVEAETIVITEVVKMGSSVEKTYPIHYANIKGNLLITSESPEITFDQGENRLVEECGAVGTKYKEIRFTPSKVGDYEGYIWITDEVLGEKLRTRVKVIARVEKNDQQITWNPTKTELRASQDWNETETKNATSTSGLPITYSITAGADVAEFDENGALVIKKAGTITITASQEGNDYFNAASLSKEFTIPADEIITFIGGNENKSWQLTNNWNFNRLPYESETPIIIAAAKLDCVVAVEGVVFQENGSLNITSQGGLKAGVSGIQGATDGTITIDNTPQGAGFLKVDPKAANKPSGKVTIKYITEAYNSGVARDEIWQYMGAPGKDMDIVADEDKTLIYHWSEQNGWEKQASEQLTPFAGYVFTQNKDKTEASFVITATPIIDDEIRIINLTCTPNGMRGGNVFANSYLAPIDVAKIDPDVDLEGVEGTFYLFNSGSWNDWQDQGGKDHMNYGVSSGQYYALSPKGASLMDKEYDQTTIPPMQGAYVVALSDNAQIKLNYAKHVYNAEASNTAMRAPQRQDDNFKRVRLQVSGKNSGADRMYVIQYDQATQGYDYGYDAKNIAAEDQVNIYTTEKDGQMEISVSDRMDSTYIGLQAGSDSEYRLRITSVIGEQLYLKDLENETLITVADGEEYVFYATPNSVNNRRFLLMDRLASEEIEDLVKVYIHDNVVHVLEAPAYSDMAVYTVGGVMMARYKLGESPCTVELSGLPTGVYLVRVADKAVKFVCK